MLAILLKKLLADRTQRKSACNYCLAAVSSQQRSEHRIVSRKKCDLVQLQRIEVLKKAAGRLRTGPIWLKPYGKHKLLYGKVDLIPVLAKQRFIVVVSGGAGIEPHEDFGRSKGRRDIPAPHVRLA